MKPSVPARPHSPLKGIALKVASVAMFVGMSALVKAAGEADLGQVMFYRSFFAMLPIVLFLGARGELLRAFHTRRPLNHVARGLIGVTATGLTFYALARLPLPEAITLNYAQPLLVVMFSAMFLGETVRGYRWSAVVIGLLGVLIISWPKLTLFGEGSGIGRSETLGVASALGAATVSAISLILVRSLVHTEKTGSIVLWFSLTATLVSLLSLPFGWTALTPMQMLGLAGAGVFGGVAQLLMTESYRHAEISTVAPFEYTSMILAIVIGYLVFGDVPTIHMLVGGVIVVGAGLFIILRERKLGTERTAAVRAVPPP